MVYIVLCARQELLAKSAKQVIISSQKITAVWIAAPNFTKESTRFSALSWSRTARTTTKNTFVLDVKKGFF